MAYNFYGGGSPPNPAAQWGVGNAAAAGPNNVLDSSAFNFGGNAPVDYNSMAAWGMPNTSLSTPSPTAGYGGPALPGGGGTGGLFGINGLGANIPTLQLGLGGISTLASLYTGLKALGQAQDQFNFQKQFAQKNLDNSVASYNTALTDRANARGVTEGQSAQQVQDYINKNRLSA